jgi:N-acetylmuramoyl-L-alanine amidase
MQMFLRVSAALGLGLILLAAGEAPRVDTGVEPMAPLSTNPSLASGQADTAAPQADSSLVADTASVGPLMLTGTETLEEAAETAIPEVLPQRKPATLAAMVQQTRGTPAEMTESLRCLATAVYWESKGEPLDGQLAVAQVILNRVEDGRFGPSICAVVKAPKQFSFVRGGALPAPVAKEQWKTAQAIATIALADAWQEIAPDATHFHATRVSPGWKLRRVASVGNHVFYR